MTATQTLSPLSAFGSPDARPKSKKSNLVVEVAKRELPPYPHIMTSEEACGFFATDFHVGLTQQQVSQARAKYGPNLLAEREGKSLWALIGEQFEDLLVRILLGAAVVSFLLALVDGEGGFSAFVEPLVILLILIANAIVSIWQESNAEKSLEALKKLQPDVARTRRHGVWQTVPAEDLVPGDIVEVRVGDRCPADLRLISIETTTLKMEQSQLTGEASSVCKSIAPLPAAALECEIQAKSNILFSTTTVAHGRAFGVVIATGMATEIGLIQAAVCDAEEDEEASPLQQKLDEFSHQLSKVIGVICLVVWIINYKHFYVPSHGGPLRGCIYYFKIAVALAVAAIPEGLPAVITTCLALGTKRMAKRHAIVRRLLSVETLGCTTVICSDKTGTLTTNEMSAVHFAVPNADGKLTHYNVEGHSFQPIGTVTQLSGGFGSSARARFDHVSASDMGMKEFVQVCSICADVTLEFHDGKIKRTGEPTEAALKVLVEKLGCPDRHLNARALQQRVRYSPEVFCEYWAADFLKLATLEFSRDRKSMSVLVRRREEGKNVLLCKGAPESIIDRCDTIILPDGTIRALSSQDKASLMSSVDAMASRALRTLAMAVRFDCGELAEYDGPSHPKHVLLEDFENFIRFEQHMTFVGLAGLVDPPRPEVAASVACCRQAGIRVMMITGDNKLTAEAIAEQCGICQARDPDSGLQLSLTGKEFEALTEQQKMQVLSSPYGAVFSRTEPKHKQMIVKLLRAMGEVVAMTGDGVNDAPALKQADIGIAMGLSGTEVAKEASAMILADDNFQTIVAAVEEGRSIYNNMKAFIRYLISSNIGEVASIFLTAALGIPEGLAPVQLLWVNLVTDGLPATALGFNPPDLDVMKRAPRRKEDKLITGWVMARYFIIGAWVGIATVGIFIHYFVWDSVARDGHSLVTYSQLSDFGHCATWKGFSVNPIYGMTGEDSCAYFSDGKVKASTLSLTVLVIIEMLNAFNALSEDYSLFTLPPWANPYLCVAALGSVLLHCLIMYVPMLAGIFNVCPLNAHDWGMVMMWSMPVILIDEILKCIARNSIELKRRGFFKMGWRLRQRAGPAIKHQ